MIRMPGKNRNSVYTILIVVLIAAGCGKSTVPKPRGYFRIDFPDKSYRLYDTTCPFEFEYPKYGIISYNLEGDYEPCWFNIEFPGYRAKIHMSYLRLDNNLESVLKESYDFAYSHSVKADAITETPYLNNDSGVYGILFDIKGNAASSVQFFVTDSIRNYLRGALYFSAQPSEDSLAPVISFFREDIIHMVETMKWK
jgi:gliding motility-associated lipoprotein GldD